MEMEKEESLALKKMKNESPAYGKRKISFGPQKRREEGGLAQQREEVMIPKEVQ